MLVIAHRGASAVAPENTLAAFREAVRVGADLIELDVRLSRDGVVVVFHDRDLSRTTNGAGPVAARTFSDLKRLDAGGYFSSRFEGERIPALEEVIHVVSTGRTGLYIELKIDRGGEDVRAELVDRTLAVIKSCRFRERSFLASFDRESLRLAKDVLPTMRPGLIFRDKEVWEQSKEEGRRDIDILCARWNIVTAYHVETAHQAGREVFAWTIDRAEELDRILPLSVDGIASNNPQWLINALKDELPTSNVQLTTSNDDEARCS